MTLGVMLFVVASGRCRRPLLLRKGSEQLVRRNEGRSNKELYYQNVLSDVQDFSVALIVPETLINFIHIYILLRVLHYTPRWTVIFVKKSKDLAGISYN